MKKIRVNLKERSYEIIIGKGVLRLLPKLVSKLTSADNIVIITNSTIKRIYSRAISDIFKGTDFNLEYIVVPDSETSKSLKCFTKVISSLAIKIRNHPSVLVALGGGVIGDLTGFVASVYKRGIPYIQIPTTLLAQVDSSIGGKTAIDLPEGKNLIGAFCQPILVLSDIGFLKSLKEAYLRSGLAEVIKYGLIMDTPLLNYVKSNYNQIFRKTDKSLEHIVYRSSINKARIVANDEKETRGIRTILNFGHTVGHAIETAFKYKGLSHGEAIAIGMVAASNISNRLGFLSAENFIKIIRLLDSVNLPVKTNGLSVSRILNAMDFDKKFIHGSNRFVLIKDIGKPVIKEGVSPRILKEAINDILVD